MAKLKKSFNPLISVVIPVYNGANYLAEAVDSALAQTYKNVEIIIINDGSNDEGATEKVARSYGKKVKYLVKKNGGVASALNFAIENMKGEYFSWLSHDDLYKPKKLEEQISVIKNRPHEDVIVATNSVILYPNGLMKKMIINKESFKYIEIFLGTSAKVGLNGCSLLIPKKAFTKAGVFNEDLKLTQDYDMWHRLSKHFNFLLVDQPLVIQRAHIEQDSVKKQGELARAADDMHYKFLLNITEKDFSDYFSVKNNIKNFYNNYRQYKKNNYIKTATLMILTLMNYYRSNPTKLRHIFYSERSFLLAYHKTYLKSRTTSILSSKNRLSSDKILEALDDITEFIKSNKDINYSIDQKKYPKKNTLTQLKGSIVDRGLSITLLSILLKLKKQLIKK